MELRACANCGVRVVPKPDMTCPSCGHSIAPSTSVDSSTGGETSSPTNPYDSPPTSTAPPSTERGGKAKEPFSHQAAKFSAYAPFILFLMGFCVQGQLEAHQGTQTGAQLSVLLSGLSSLTTLAAFVLGVIGIVGGIQRRAWRTIAYAVVGLVLNAALIALWASVVLTLLGRNG